MLVLFYFVILIFISLFFFSTETVFTSFHRRHKAAAVSSALAQESLWLFTRTLLATAEATLTRGLREGAAHQKEQTLDRRWAPSALREAGRGLEAELRKTS